MSEVGIAHLRQDLRAWLDRVSAGDEVIITDRGRPVARLSGIDMPAVLERLIAEGKVTLPRRSRPQARGLKRARSRGSVSEYIVAERERRRA